MGFLQYLPANFCVDVASEEVCLHAHELQNGVESFRSPRRFTQDQHLAPTGKLLEDIQNFHDGELELDTTNEREIQHLVCVLEPYVDSGVRLVVSVVLVVGGDLLVLGGHVSNARELTVVSVTKDVRGPDKLG